MSPCATILSKGKIDIAPIALLRLLVLRVLSLDARNIPNKVKLVFFALVCFLHLRHVFAGLAESRQKNIESREAFEERMKKQSEQHSDAATIGEKVAPLACATMLLASMDAEKPLAGTPSEKESAEVTLASTAEHEAAPVA